MQVVTNSEENEAIYPSYRRRATDTRLFASRPHLFNHLSHQLPKNEKLTIKKRNDTQTITFSDWFRKLALSS